MTCWTCLRLNNNFFPLYPEASKQAENLECRWLEFNSKTSLSKNRSDGSYTNKLIIIIKLLFKIVFHFLPYSVMSYSVMLHYSFSRYFIHLFWVIFPCVWILKSNNQINFGLSWMNPERNSIICKEPTLNYLYSYIPAMTIKFNIQAVLKKRIYKVERS